VVLASAGKQPVPRLRVVSMNVLDNSERSAGARHEEGVGWGHRGVLPAGERSELGASFGASPVLHRIVR